MEKIKSFCILLICTSALIFISTYVSSIYPQGNQTENAYTDLIKEYEKIATESEIDVELMRTIVTKEEFDATITREEIKNRSKNILDSTSNYVYIYSDETRNEISEQFALLYDQQQSFINDKAYINIMRLIRLFCIILFVLSTITLALCRLKLKVVKKQSINHSK